MTAQINPNIEPSVAPATAPTNSWGQVSGGAAALAFPAILELMTILMKLMGMYNEQANYQVATQIASAQAASKATEEAAKDQAFSTACQAAASFAGGATAVAGMAYQGSQTKAVTELRNSFQTRGTQLSNLNETVLTRAADMNADRNVGTAGRDDPINSQIRELTHGQFKNETLASDDSYKAAISHMTDDELAEFTAHFSKEKAQMAEYVNSHQGEINNILTKVGTYKDMFKGFVVDPITQGVSASYQAKKGTEDAAATLGSTNAQIAGNMHSASQQAANKAYDETMQALAMVQQLAQTGRSPV